MNLDVSWLKRAPTEKSRWLVTLAFMQLIRTGSTLNVSGRHTSFARSTFLSGDSWCRRSRCCRNVAGWLLTHVVEPTHRQVFLFVASKVFNWVSGATHVDTASCGGPLHYVMHFMVHHIGMELTHSALSGCLGALRCTCFFFIDQQCDCTDGLWGPAYTVHIGSADEVWGTLGIVQSLGSGSHCICFVVEDGDRWVANVICILRLPSDSKLGWTCSLLLSW